MPSATKQKAVMACLLSAASPAKPEPPSPKASSFKSNPAEARKVLALGKRTVLNSLKDPDSAKFRDLRTSRDLWVCGEVNAKNSMGGYVGFQRFIVLLSMVTFDDGSETFQDRWWMDCDGLERERLEALKQRFK